MIYTRILAQHSIPGRLAAIYSRGSIGMIRFAVGGEVDMQDGRKKKLDQGWQRPLLTSLQSLDLWFGVSEEFDDATQLKYRQHA